MVKVDGSDVFLSNNLDVVVVEIAVAIKLLTILNKAENGISFDDTLNSIVAQYNAINIEKTNGDKEPSQMELLSFISEQMRTIPENKPHNLDDEE